MAAAPKRWLRSWLNVEPEEARLALLLFLHCMLVVAAAFVIGRSVGNTLFLQRVDNRWLPYTYVVAAVGVSTVSAVYARFAGRLRSDRLIATTAILFATVVLLTRAGLALAPGSWLLLGFVYVLFDIIGDISIIQVWTLAGDLLTARQAKRLFAVVGAGGTVAGIVFGGLLSISVRLFGTENQLVIVAAMLLGVAFIARAIGKVGGRHVQPPPSLAGEPQAHGLLGDFRRVIKSSHLVTIAVLVAVITVVSVLIDYQWKLAANAAYAGDEGGLASYFGIFCLVTNGLALIVQVFVGRRLLERFGIRAGLSVLPVLLLAAMAGLMVAPVGAALWAASAAKGGDGTLRYSVHKASMEMLYRPVGAFRPRAKAIIEGIAKPLWAAVGGLVIAALAAVVAPRHLGALTISLLVAWIILVGMVRRHYVMSLERTLRSRRALDPDAAQLDRATIKALEQALVDGDARQTANALTLLEDFPDARWRAPIDHLLSSPDASLRRRAAEYVARHGGELRPELMALIDDSDPATAGAALAAVWNHGSGHENARAKLTAMCNAESARTRSAAAKAIDLVVEPPRDALAQLITDDDPDVRRDAVIAARSVSHQLTPDEPLVEHLLCALDDPRTRRPAADALVPIGAPLVPKLRARLAPLMLRRTQVAVVGVLARIPDMTALRELEGAMNHSRERTRHAAVDAVVQLARRHVDLVERARLEAQLDAELRTYFQQSVMWFELGDIEKLLLAEALELKQRRCAERVLRLVSGLHPNTDFQLVQSALRSPKDWLRANAVELLDNTISGRIRPAVLALFDDHPLERHATFAAELFDEIEHAPRSQWLDRLARDEDPWLAACALYEHAKDHAEASHFEDLAAHDHPLIRDTAAAALAGQFTTTEAS